MVVSFRFYYLLELTSISTYPYPFLGFSFMDFILHLLHLYVSIRYDRVLNISFYFISIHNFVLNITCLIILGIHRPNHFNSPTWVCSDFTFECSLIMCSDSWVGSHWGVNHPPQYEHCFFSPPCLIHSISITALGGAPNKEATIGYILFVSLDIFEKMYQSRVIRKL